MTLTQKTTHVAEIPSQLITQFRDQPNMVALLGTYLEQVQDIEDVVWQLLAIPGSIDSQEGAQLDLWGKIVGQPREGRTDAVYRQWIQARLIINRASGLPDELKKIIELVTSNGHTYHEYYPAGFLITLIDAYTGDAAALAALLTETRAAGVGGGLIYSTVDDDSTFTFASGDAEEASTAQGWAGDDEMLINGDFSAWTGNDPDDWVVEENSLTTFVTEVGSGESYGGAGAGACNLRDTSGALAAYIDQAASIISGQSYKITIVISAISGTLGVEDPNYSQFTTGTYTTTGMKEITFTASGSTVEMRLYTASSADDITIDSVTLAPSPAFGGSFADVEEI